MSSRSAGPGPSGAAALVALRMTAGALILSPVVIAVAIVIVLGAADEPFALGPLLLGPLVLGVAAAGVVEVVGYRMPAIAPGTEREAAERASREAFTARLMMRFALCEAVLFVSLAAGFVVRTGGLAIFLVGAVVALALLAWHAWPGERVMRRCQESLEREGGVSYLREAYGLPPAATSGPVIQEL